MWKKIKAYSICFILGVCSAFIFTNGSREKVNAELQSTRWTLESAIRINAKNTNRIQELSNELTTANRIVTDQFTIIDNQQYRLEEQERIIRTIIENISGEGGEINNKLESIADGFRKLYDIYYVSSERK